MRPHALPKTRLPRNGSSRQSHQCQSLFDFQLVPYDDWHSAVPQAGTEVLPEGRVHLACLGAGLRGILLRRV